MGRTQDKPVGRGHFFKDIRHLLPAFALIGLLTLLAYAPIWNNGYVAFDDHEYVLKNEMITSLAPSHLVEMITSQVAGNYHPLTMFSYALGYQLYGTSARGHHLTNFLIHLLNALLVFYFVWLLTKRKKLMAAVVAVLFAIHPMHVESVCWMAERKDTLYTFFLLLACIQYFSYLKNFKKGAIRRKHYFWTWLFFVCSVLSKGMGVVIPLLFLAIDYFVGRLYRRQEWNLAAFKEKIPFLAFSIFMGIVAIFVQRSVGALNDGVSYSFFQRLIFASYGYIQYLVQIIAPIDPSIFYAYPYNLAQKGIPLHYYLYPFMVIGLVGYGIFAFAKKQHKALIFGFLFYTFSIITVLQLLSVGAAIMADRYTYVSYIGIFFIIAYYFYRWYNKGGMARTIVSLALGGYILLCSVLTFNRVQDWENTDTLFTGVIEKYPREILPYRLRGQYFAGKGETQKAIADFEQIIKLYPNHPSANLFLADLKRQTNPEDALSAFNKAIKVNPNNADVYVQRGIYYFEQDDWEAASNDYEKAISLDPKNSHAYYNRGSLLMAQKNYPLALEDMTQAIVLMPDFPGAYINRGNIHKLLKDHQAALKDYSKAIDISPNFSGLYNRAILYRDQLNKTRLALKDANHILEIEPQDARGYSLRASIHYQLSKFKEGLADAGKAIELNPQMSDAYAFKAYIYKAMNNNEKALINAKKAKELGFGLGKQFMDSLQ